MPGGAILFVAAGLLASAASPSHAGCFESARAIDAAAVIARDDVALTACRDAATPALRYDRAAGGAVATSAIAPATYLGRLVVATSQTLARGVRLSLRSAIGAVTIERPVTLMQPARSGTRAFVRDDEGNVFAVPVYLEESP